MKGGAAAQTGRSAARPSPPSRPSSRPEPKSTSSVGSKPSAPAGAASHPSKSKGIDRAGRNSSVANKSAPGKPLDDLELFEQSIDIKSADSLPGASAVAFDASADPLDVKSSAGKEAIPAGRQRTKSKPYKVTCPMCETVGYVSQTAAGKEVRCANSQCLVPVFVAPRIQKKTVEAEPKAKSGIPIALLALIGVLLVSGIGGALYFYNQPSVPTPNSGPVVLQVPTGTVNDASQGHKTNAPPDGESVHPVIANTQLTLSEERDPVLAIMEQATKEHDRNLRPPYCQRATAQTAADCGDLGKAKTYLDQLANSKRELDRVGPLTAVAWQQLKRGEKVEAGKTLENALTAAADLPAIGRYSVDTAAWLAAALVAVGRDKEAHALVARFPAEGSTGRLVAAMSTARAWTTWDILTGEQERPLLEVASLQNPIVVEIAVSRGFAAEAFKFLESVPSPGERIECQIVWAEAAARGRDQGKSADPLAIDPLLEKLPPASRARLQARLGNLRLRVNDRPGAEKLLDSAIATLGKIAAKRGFVIPSWKKLAALEFPDPGPARLNALALAEIARLEGDLRKRDEAQNHLGLAIDLLHASAPNLIAARQTLEEAGRLRATEFQEPVPIKGRKEVIAQAKRKNQERANADLEKVKQISKALVAAAEARFALQTAILETALAWDDPAHLWQVISPAATAQDADMKEPYFKTALPWKLEVNLKRAGDATTAEKIDEAAGSNLPPSAVVLDLLAQKAPESTDVSSLARKMQFPDANRPESERATLADRERATLAGSSYLLHAGKVGDAIVFVRMFDDSLMKEEALEWTAALACRLNFTRQIKDILQAASFIPTESVSAYRGFLLGLLAREVAPEAVRPSGAAGEPPGDGAKHLLRTNEPPRL
jgi:hypothetical protein